MSDRESRKAVEKIIRAWTEPGRVPEYHRVAQARLHREWPVLAKALEELVRASER